MIRVDVKILIMLVIIIIIMMCIAYYFTRKDFFEPILMNKSKDSDKTNYLVQSNSEKNDQYYGIFKNKPLPLIVVNYDQNGMPINNPNDVKPCNLNSNKTSEYVLDNCNINNIIPVGNYDEKYY